MNPLATLRRIVRRKSARPPEYIGVTISGPDVPTGYLLKFIDGLAEDGLVTSVQTSSIISECTLDGEMTPWPGIQVRCRIRRDKLAEVREYLSQPITVTYAKAL